jgi:hypothetical protein
VAGYFPNITEEMLTPFQALIAQLATDPKVLDQPECPYNSAVKDFLRRLSGVTLPGANTGAMSEDDLEQEIADLLRSAKEQSGKLDSTMDPKDRMTVLRGQGQLIEKLIELKERRLNLKHIGDFKKHVVEILERVLTPAQRTEYVKLLGDLLK